MTENPTTKMSSCGTTSGYTIHRQRGQVPCLACKAAWAAYYRDYRAGRKKAT